MASIKLFHRTETVLSPREADECPSSDGSSSEQEAVSSNSKNYTMLDSFVSPLETCYYLSPIIAASSHSPPFPIPRPTAVFKPSPTSVECQDRRIQESRLRNARSQSASKFYQQSTPGLHLQTGLYNKGLLYFAPLFRSISMFPRTTF
jgi:hypothetical protein